VPSYAEVVAELRAAGCVFAEDEAVLLVEAGGDLEALVRRRVAGEPLEQLLGWADFGGLRIHVDPDVFVPRRRTEELARRTADLALPGDIVVDLCCGTGAIAAFVRASVPGVDVHAVDVLPEAVACARKNLGDQVYEGDLFSALPETLRGEIALVVANPPHVPSDEIVLMPTEARDHEPRRALDGGGDGLDCVRAILSEVADWLRPAGSLLLEVGAAQGTVAVEACLARGLESVSFADPDSGTTVVVATAQPGQDPDGSSDRLSTS